jgi:N6-L-threonylcarbamoyladenine synthase
MAMPSRWLAFIRAWISDVFTKHALKRGIMLILGLESSCDETAAALVRSDKVVLAQEIASQLDVHAPWGGVVPELAARAHVEQLTPLIARVLAKAGIAATAGPGLIGGVMVGLITGKALALASAKPLLAINHLEGHALSPRLVADVAFPYLLLLVSGGHCQLLRVEGVGRYQRLGTTLDDAAGECFDKVAKMLGLGFPGGPALEAAARTGRPDRFALPHPLKGSLEPHFSFAGLKSAVRRLVEQHTPLSAQDIADLAAATQAAISACLVDRTQLALTRSPLEGKQALQALVVAGGVAANANICAALQDLSTRAGLPFIAPPPWLCTDNAAMIAWAGVERLALGLVDSLDVVARPRWPLDPHANSARGAGVKA